MTASLIRGGPEIVAPDLPIAHACEIRAFAPLVRVPEDPVTGSLNASVAQWLVGTGSVPDRYTVAQGARVGRTGEISVRIQHGKVWVGGHTATRFLGTARV